MLRKSLIDKKIILYFFIIFSLILIFIFYSNQYPKFVIDYDVTDKIEEMERKISRLELIKTYNLLKNMKDGWEIEKGKWQPKNEAKALLIPILQKIALLEPKIKTNYEGMDNKIELDCKNTQYSTILTGNIKQIPSRVFSLQLFSR